MPNDKVQDYKTIWIQFDKKSHHKHQLFFKEHSVRNQEPEYPKGRTLFLLNIPPYATIDALKSAFDKLCGTVESIRFVNPKGFKTAYLVFKKESVLEKALSLSKNSVITLHDDTTDNCDVGIAKWCKEYNASLCDEEQLKKEVEEYMRTYDERIAARLENEKAEKEREAAEDGWVTVGGQKKRGQFAPKRKESTITKLHEKEEQRKRKKQLLNFYTFQIRETKKQNLAELRKKFELDKQRLKELKQKRTFKPF